MIEWYKGYQKRKAEDIGIGVCQKTKKKKQKNYGHKHEIFCV